MNIIEMRAENFKRLSVVQITPTGAIVDINGKNGMGKTSVLDAIAAALDRASLDQSALLSRGASKAIVELKLGTGGVVQYVVTRTITAKGHYLTVETPDGMMPKQPQTMLDEMIGALSFDPLEFMRLKPQEKFELIRRLVKIEVDLDAIDKNRADAYAERTTAKREHSRAVAVADAIVVPKDAPDQPVDVDALMDGLAGVDKFNAQVRAQRSAAEQLVGLRAQLARGIEEARAQIAKLTAALVTMEKNHAEAVLMVEHHEANPPAELRDAEALRETIRKGQAANAAYKARIARGAADKNVAALSAEVARLDEAIGGFDTVKRDAIASAKMPVDGLTLVEGGVLYNGLPLNQASDAEQLLVSTAIAAALNPKLRVIRMRDGSLLDSSSLATLAKFAEANDLQIWMERVDESGKSGIIMEDGHVRGQEELVEAHNAKAAASVESAEFDGRKYLDEQMKVLEKANLGALEGVNPIIRAKLKADIALTREWNTFYLGRRREFEKVKV